MHMWFHAQLTQKNLDGFYYVWYVLHFLVAFIGKLYDMYLAKKCLSILLFLDKVGLPFQIQLEKFLYLVGTDYGDLVKPYFMLITFFNKYIHLWCRMVMIDTTLPNHKRMDLLKKVIKNRSQG